MKGKILEFDLQGNTGIISGNDGKRYQFTKADWKADKQPMNNQIVDFSIEEDKAKDIYLDKVVSQDKNKIVAGLLAFFLGALGIHKFYLGCNKAGIIMLLCFFPGMFLFGIPLIIVGIIAFVEFIIYIVKSDDEFQETYVDNQKCWF
ncbi:MAG: NINE protein [Sulfurovum sp.]|nr:NINE protein [Sulfurovum sp.]